MVHARECSSGLEPPSSRRTSLQRGAASSGNNFGLPHPLKARRIPFHRVDGLPETRIFGGAEVVLPIEVEDGHDEVQEGPGEAVHDAFFQAMFLSERIPGVLVFLDELLDRVWLGARRCAFQSKEGADARPFSLP